MKKKIGIITVSRTTNFGAELQAFALQHKLNQLGYDAEVIDYLYFKNRRHRPSKKSRPELSFSIKERIKSYFLYHLVAPCIDMIFPLVHRTTKTKNHNFRRFHRDYIPFSKEFRTIEALYDYRHDYDVVISGSDQVWNPATFSSLKPYLLDFVSSDTLRMSYAASFGVAEVSETYKEVYAGLFQEMDHLGVREEQGKALVEQMAQREATVVLDPTLLLSKEEWQYVTPNVHVSIKEPYILIYDLHPSEPLLEVVEQVRKKLGMSVYRLCKRSFKNPDNLHITNIEDAGPAEFIALFSNASFVVTNSFHGTAFSVNFKVPFYSVLKPKKANNSRITNFLEKLELSHRIVWENKPLKTANTNMTYEAANQKLNTIKKISLDYLENSLKR